MSPRVMTGEEQQQAHEENSHGFNVETYAKFLESQGQDFSADFARSHPRDARMSAGQQSAHAAKARLQAAHLDEYAGYQQEERVKRGLPPITETKSAEFLRRRVHELEGQLAQLRAGESEEA